MAGDRERVEQARQLIARQRASLERTRASLPRTDQRVLRAAGKSPLQERVKRVKTGKVKQQVEQALTKTEKEEVRFEREIAATNPELALPKYRAEAEREAESNLENQIKGVQNQIKSASKKGNNSKVKQLIVKLNLLTNIKEGSGEDMVRIVNSGQLEQIASKVSKEVALIKSSIPNISSVEYQRELSRYQTVGYSEKEAERLAIWSIVNQQTPAPDLADQIAKQGYTDKELKQAIGKQLGQALEFTPEKIIGKIENVKLEKSEFERFKLAGFTEAQARLLAKESTVTQQTPTPERTEQILVKAGLTPPKDIVGKIGFVLRQPELAIRGALPKIDTALTEAGVPATFRTTSIVSPTLPVSIGFVSPIGLQALQPKDTVKVTDLTASETVDVGTFLIPIISSARAASFVGEVGGSLLQRLSAAEREERAGELVGFVSERPVETGFATLLAFNPLISKIVSGTISKIKTRGLAREEKLVWEKGKPTDRGILGDLYPQQIKTELTEKELTSLVRSQAKKYNINYDRLKPIDREFLLGQVRARLRSIRPDIPPVARTAIERAKEASRIEKAKAASPFSSIDKSFLAGQFGAKLRTLKPNIPPVARTAIERAKEASRIEKAKAAKPQLAISEIDKAFFGGQLGTRLRKIPDVAKTAIERTREAARIKKALLRGRIRPANIAFEKPVKPIQSAETILESLRKIREDANIFLKDQATKKLATAKTKEIIKIKFEEPKVPEGYIAKEVNGQILLQKVEQKAIQKVQQVQKTDQLQVYLQPTETIEKVAEQQATKIRLNMFGTTDSEQPAQNVFTITKQDIGQAQAQKEGQKQKQRQKQETAKLTFQVPAFKVPAFKFETVEVTKQKQRQKQRTATAITTRQRILRRPPLLPSKETRLEEKKESSIFVSGFDVYVKRRGKWIKVSREALTRAEAIKTGAGITKQTLAASFKIVGTKELVEKKDTAFTPSPTIFRSYRVSKGKRIPLGDTWIQKKGKRLGSFGEVSEIQRARKGGFFK